MSLRNSCGGLALILFICFCLSEKTRAITPIGVEAWDAGDTGYFLAVSDIHYDPNSTLQYPTYGQDSPVWLLNSTLAAMSSILPSPDMILLTGDLTVHSYANPPPFEQELVSSAISSLFKQSFPSSDLFVWSPILAIGNNDLVPRYPAPPSSGVPIEWFQNLTRYWPSLNSTKEAYESFIYGGYYRVDPFPDASLTILVLHTNYWSSSNIYTPNDPDPVGQFAWLEKELALAEVEGRFVWLMGHIPPGIDLFNEEPLWYEHFLVRFINITSPYIGSSIITAAFFAHQHKVRFRMQGSSDVPPFPIQEHSSVSPIYINNPTFRLYTYNRTSFQVLDYQDWFLDLSHFQGSNDPLPQWQSLFSSAIKEYGLVSPLGLFSDGGVWWDFIARMNVEEDLYQRYINNSYSGLYSATNTYNRTANMCDFAFLFQSDFRSCVKVGGPFKLQTIT